ncbi:hypothetical protein PINS_up000134 [Pythium insidiosum]|nr:hypothetical protein PINS_up000134 [Pythium insidiosum]
MLCLESGTHLHLFGMLLLNAGAELSLQDAQGWTALHYAAANGNASLFFNILQLCDADLVEKRNKHGETLQDVAQMRRHDHIEALLQDWRDGKQIAIERDDDRDIESDDIDTSETSDNDSASD